MRPIDRFVAWLRAGYPHGLPEHDYVPALALLRRRLTDDEIDDLGQELVRQGVIPADRVDVAVGILKRTDELPTPEEQARVQNHLRDAGLPVDVD